MPVSKKRQDAVAALTDPQRWLQDFGDYLYSYARWRLQDDALAEDIVQETLLAALSARTRFNGNSSEKTWLTGILKNKIMDVYREQIRELITDDIEALSDAFGETEGNQLFDSRGNWIRPPQDWGNPYITLNNEEFMGALEYCLERLTPVFSKVLRMKLISGQQTQEICNELKLTATNVNVILYRARLKLRRCLEMNWSDET